MACNGVDCIRYKAQKVFGMGRYQNGQSRCQVCDQWINYAGTYCPCCNTRLRKNPRNSKSKVKFRETGVVNHYGIDYSNME